MLINDWCAYNTHKRHKLSRHFLNLLPNLSTAKVKAKKNGASVKTNKYIGSSKYRGDYSDGEIMIDDADIGKVNVSVRIFFLNNSN